DFVEFFRVQTLSFVLAGSALIDVSITYSLGQFASGSNHLVATRTQNFLLQLFVVRQVRVFLKPRKLTFFLRNLFLLDHSWRRCGRRLTRGGEIPSRSFRLLFLKRFRRSFFAGFRSFAPEGSSQIYVLKSFFLVPPVSRLRFLERRRGWRCYSFDVTRRDFQGRLRLSSVFLFPVIGDVRYRACRLHVLQEPMLFRPGSYGCGRLGRGRTRRRLLSAVFRNRLSRQNHSARWKLGRVDGVVRGRPGSRDLPRFGFSRRWFVLTWLILGNGLSRKHDLRMTRGRWSGTLVAGLLRSCRFLNHRTFLAFGVFALRRLFLCLTAV